MKKTDLVREKIEKLAEEFNLKYSSGIFQVNLLSKKEFVLLNYLSGCPDKPYAKFGKTKTERVKRVSEFLSSKEFLHLTKRAGGCVTNKKVLYSVLRKIKNKKIKNMWKRIISKLNLKPKHGVPVIMKPVNRFMLNVVLFHEWVHVLLIYNKISFQRFNKKYWTLDEGLTMYMQNFSEKKKTDLESYIRKKKKLSINARNALVFNNILKDKKTPQERYNAIMNFMKRKLGEIKWKHKKF